MGWSLSPTSGVGEIVRWDGSGGKDGGLAFEHVLDEDAALGDFLVDDKLLIIGGDEEDHLCCRLLARRDGDGEEEGKNGKRLSGNSVFKGMVPLRKHPPLSHSSTRKLENDLVWPLARAAVGHGLGPFLLHW